jgi:DNA-binding CsgD family transcriptional regulator/PAS domain-containing protein
MVPQERPCVRSGFAGDPDSQGCRPVFAARVLSRRLHTSLKRPEFRCSHVVSSLTSVQWADGVIDMDSIVASLGDTVDAVFAIDAECRIVSWNRAASVLLGLTGDAVGRPCHEIVAGLDEAGEAVCSANCPRLATAISGEGSSSAEVAVRTRSGARLWMTVMTFSAPPERRSQYVLVHSVHSIQRQHDLAAFALHVLGSAQPLMKTPTLASSCPTDEMLCRLSPREMEVLRLFARGAGPDEIAESLSISSVTVRGHAQRILDKLGVHSRIQAVVYALEHGLKL